MARKLPGGTCCHYCGTFNTVLACSDIPNDDGRIDLYCTNDACEVTLFVVLAMRGGNQFERGDVRALDAIDAGFGYDRLPEDLAASDPAIARHIAEHGAYLAMRRKLS